MNRVCYKISSKKKRKKILKLAKGYYGARSKLYTVAKNAVEKSLIYSYIGRKNKKRFFKKLWIQRINAFANINKLNYSKLMFLFKKKKIFLNKKSLTYLINNHYNDLIKIIKNIL